MCAPAARPHTHTQCMRRARVRAAEPLRPSAKAGKMAAESMSGVRVVAPRWLGRLRQARAPRCCQVCCAWSRCACCPRDGGERCDRRRPVELQRGGGRQVAAGRGSKRPHGHESSTIRNTCGCFFRQAAQLASPSQHQKSHVVPVRDCPGLPVRNCKPAPVLNVLCCCCVCVCVCVCVFV